MIHLPTLVHDFNSNIPMKLLCQKYKLNGAEIINILNKFTDESNNK